MCLTVLAILVCIACIHTRIILITQLYDAKNESRNKELQKALDLNTKNEYIDELHLLQYDTQVSLLNSTKIKLLSTVSERLSFAEAFKYANEHLKGEIIIVANNDISFDHSLSLLLHPAINNMLTKQYTAFFLSRHERRPMTGIGTQCGPLYMGSHDAFILSPPLPASFLSRIEGIVLGQAGGDARMVYEARMAGLVVRNVCEEIKCWHHHDSAVRSAALREANLGGLSETAPPERLNLLLEWY